MVTTSGSISNTNFGISFFDNITILTGYLVMFLNTKYSYFPNDHKTSFVLNLVTIFDKIVTHVTGAYFEGHRLIFISTICLVLKVTV